MSYAVEWLPGAAAVGAVAFLCVPSFVLIGLVVVLLAAGAALVALAGAIVATPYLLVRSLGRRQRGRSAAAQQRGTGRSTPTPNQRKWIGAVAAWRIRAWGLISSPPAA